MEDLQTLKAEQAKQAQEIQRKPLMSFSSLNFKGDLNIQWYEDGIAVEAKDVKEPEAKMLADIIIKNKIPCKRTETKTGVFLQTNNVKKILVLFLAAQQQALKKDQFLFLTYTDKSKEVFTKEKSMSIEEVKGVLQIKDKEIKDTKKIAAAHTHGCGEDIDKSLKISKALDEVK